MQTERPESYPERGPVPNDWNAASYKPTEFTDPKVLAAPAWAESADFAQAVAARAARSGKDADSVLELFSSYEPLPLIDGRPKNPRGPTGISGRGLLGKWGPNFAADPIVFRVQAVNAGARQLQMISIRRVDNGLWAIPGGMTDFGEKVSGTLSRELAEEALGKEASPAKVAIWEKNFEMFFERDGVKVYEGYVDDFRNTDDAHMQTAAYYFEWTPSSHRGVRRRPNPNSGRRRSGCALDDYQQPESPSHARESR